MADRICSAVNTTMKGSITTEQRDAIRVAALLHDIGHLPFGHTLEDEVGLFGKHDGRARLQGLLEGGEILEVVRAAGAEELLRRARAILEHDAAETLPKESAFMADIVANTICADLLDYLRRDFYHLGLSYNFDDRIFDYMTVGPDEKGRRRFAINLFKTGKFRHDATTQILEILNLRYTLAECALFHHAKDAHSAMLSRALLESEFLLRLASTGRKQEKSGALRSMYEANPGSQVAEYFADGAEIDPGLLLQIGDDELVSLLALDSNRIASQLASMIESRQLYRMALEVGYDVANSANVQNRIIEQLHKKPTGRFAMERQIEEELGLPRGSVLLYCPSEKMNSKVARVHVLDSSGVALPLEESEKRSGNALTGGFLEAQLTRFQRLWRMYVFVHPALSTKEADRAAKYVRAIYQLNSAKLPTAERERQTSQELKDLAVELIGERFGNRPYKEIAQLRDEALVEMRNRASDKPLRSIIEALGLALGDVRSPP
jgi:HD superfamily phosphohydrolase